MEKIFNIYDFKNRLNKRDIEINDSIKSILENKNEISFISDLFRNHFSKLWFREKTSLDIVWIDKTVLFTNSAITSLKEYIKDSKQVKDYFISQKCIRVQNLDTNLDEYLKYSSSFSMLWSFVSREKYEIFMEQIENFLEKIWISNDIVFVLDKSYIKLNRYFQNKSNTIILESENELAWTFWEWNIMIWKWISIRIIDKNTGKLTDIWNILEILSNWEIKAYWFWLWLETFLTRKNWYLHPSELYIKFENNSSIETHLYDTINLIIDLYDNNIKLWNHKSWYELKKTFKKLKTIIYKSNISIFELINKFKKIEFSKFNNIKYTQNIINDFLEINKFKINKKEISILLDKNSNTDNIILELNSKYSDIIVDFLYEFEWNQIEKWKKSVTLSIYFSANIWKEKEVFSHIKNNFEKELILR